MSLPLAFVSKNGNHIILNLLSYHLLWKNMQGKDAIYSLEKKTFVFCIEGDDLILNYTFAKTPTLVRYMIHVSR